MIKSGINIRVVILSSVYDEFDDFNQKFFGVTCELKNRELSKVQNWIALNWNFRLHFEKLNEIIGIKK